MLITQPGTLVGVAILMVAKQQCEVWSEATEKEQLMLEVNNIILEKAPKKVY